MVQRSSWVSWLWLPLTLTAQKLNLVFWLSVVMFPLAIVCMGMVTWWKRR